MAVKLVGSLDNVLSTIGNQIQQLEDFLFKWRNKFERPASEYSVYKEEVKDHIDMLLRLGENIRKQPNHEPLKINESFCPSWSWNYYFQGVYIGGWLYQGKWYEITSNHSTDEQRLLVLEYGDKERQKFERLMSKFSQEQTERLEYQRERIPEDVRIEVWRRDQGKCAQCGSREKLEYDHIVPVSRGGSNTARNVELLCEGCNRAKGNRIQ